ncbi:MAG: ATP-binding cassette domain-containing protein, partial [Chloroflexi bacterium]|nr:ATP-binding cassette domain-containing protein [Chloroflexota bacterium]
MIKIDHLSYAYPNKNQAALCAVSWQIETGDFVLVAGPSGSGKSTLLRCLNGLVPHFSGGTVHGQVTVNGIDALAAGPHELSRHVGFVLQNPEAQAVLDRVEPEIAFGLENAALPPQEMRVRVEEVLDLLDLTPLRERPLTTLSGGERQRVAIAAALALRPQILVLDEPTSQLDPQSAEDVLRALARLNEDLGLTIILAEHRLERVLRYVDRVTFMENGRIQTDAPVQQAIQQMPQLPPLVRLGRQLGWEPLPLTVKAGRRFARKVGQVCKSASLQVSPSPTPSLLKVDNLRFAYNGRPTLNGINLAVHAGETVAVMG